MDSHVKGAVIAGIATIAAALILVAPQYLSSRDEAQKTSAASSPAIPTSSNPPQTERSPPPESISYDDLPNDKKPIDRENRSTRRYPTHDGHTIEIYDLGVSISVNFLSTLGVEYIELTVVSPTQGTIRLLAMSAGKEHLITINKELYRLVVTAIDWKERTATIILARNPNQ